MMAAANGWQNLVNAALVGTERQAEIALLTEGEMGDLLNRLTTSNAETKLLNAAAAMNLYQKAGQSAITISPVPTLACPTDDLPLCPTAAASALSQMLGGLWVPLLGEWLALAARSGWRAPEKLLPSLLEFGRNNAEVRSAIRPVLGQRGVWLAQQSPAWQYVDVSTDAAIWDDGKISQRVQYLKQLRKQDPAAARELLAGSINQEAAKDRITFVRQFAIGLSVADLSFLEPLMHDRSQEVRLVVMKLLSRLPESSLCQQAIEMMTELLTIENTGKTLYPIQISPPQTVTPAMKRLGLDQPVQRSEESFGEKATALVNIITRVPLAVWADRFQLSLADLLHKTRQDEWYGAIVHGLVNAIIVQKHAAMASQMITHIRIREFDLFQILDDQMSNHLVKTIYPLSDDQRTFNFLKSESFSWNTEVSEIAVNLFDAELQKEKSNWSFTYWMTTNLATRLHLDYAEALPRLQQLATQNTYVQDAIEKTCQALQFRQDMVKALQPESG